MWIPRQESLSSPLSIDRRQFFGTCAAGAAAASAAPSLALTSLASSEAPRHTVPLAFWALTGLLKSADVDRQLDVFAKAGWGTVLYPRWGLEIEYLSDAWFDRIRYIVDQAAARSMEIWLYDEFCWPSGHAKGLVTKDHPELAAQMLVVEADGSSRIEVSPGDANLVMPEATRRFLAVTHDRYAAAVGEHFGKTVRAIFTDEPSLPAQHRPPKPGSKGWRFMWSETLNRELGDDFRKRLTAAGNRVADPALWRDYWAAFAKVYHDAWTKPIADWCQTHNIAMSGHLLGEDRLASHVKFYGSLRRQLNAFHIPGIDEISTRCDVDKCEALTLATIAEYPGRERMCEVFALGPCHMQMGAMRKMIDLCAACGVDRFVMAISPFDLRGNYFKRPYMSVIGFQQPWFRDYARPLADYLAESAKVARKAQPLGIKWPSDEAIWELAGPDPAKSKAIAQMNEKLQKEARIAIRDRMTVSSAMPFLPHKKMEAVWTFEPVGLNSLRIDGPSLNVEALPSTAELSIQTQLVRSLQINGAKIDMSAAPPDTQFDLSYRRIPVAKLLRVGENTFKIETGEAKPLPFLPALILWGNFAVDAKRRIVAPLKTMPIGDWRLHGYPEFCGVGRYTATVNWTKPPLRLFLDSRGYPAKVAVNGRDCGRRPWGPFEFDLRDAARIGANSISVEIAGTIGHLFTAKTSPPIGLWDVWTI